MNIITFIKKYFNNELVKTFVFKGYVSNSRKRYYCFVMTMNEGDTIPNVYRYCASSMIQWYFKPVEIVVSNNNPTFLNLDIQEAYNKKDAIKRMVTAEEL